MILLSFKNLNWKWLVVTLWLVCGLIVMFSGCFFPSIGCSGRIIIVWDPHVLELVESRIGSFSVCYKFKSLHDNFVWGLIGVYGHNNDNVRSALFEELVTFMSNWDTPWCLGADFNVVRFPFESSTGGRMTFALIEFSNFSDSCNLIILSLAMRRSLCCLELIGFCLKVNGRICSTGAPGYPS